MPTAQRRLKTLPDIEVLAYPSDDLPRTLVEPFAGQDAVADLLKNQSGEVSPIIGLTPDNIADDASVAQWGQPGFLPMSDELQFTRISAAETGGEKDGTQAATKDTRATSATDLRGELAGFTVRRLTIPLHFQLDTFDPQRDPSGAPEVRRGHIHAFRRVIWHAGRGIPRSAFAPDGSPLPRKVYDLRGALQKVPNHWETVVDASRPRRQRVFHSCQAPDDVVWVQTENWEENLGFEFDFTDLQVARGQQGHARIRVEWGKVFSIVLRDGAAPTFEKRVPPKRKTAAEKKEETPPPPDEETPPPPPPEPVTEENAFRIPPIVEKELPKKKKKTPVGDDSKKTEIPPDPFWKTVSSMGGSGTVDWAKIKRVSVRVERICGRFRFTVRFGDGAPLVTDITDRRAAPTRVNSPPAVEAIPASWARAPIRVSFGGVSVHLGGSELRALDESTGQGITARFGRNLRAPGAHDEAAATGIEPKIYAMGWARDRTGITFPAAQIYNREVGIGLYERALAYVCELSASPNGKDVPLLTVAAYRWNGVSAPLGARLPLDITPACTGSARIQTGQPPDVPSSEMSLKVDDVLLKQLAMPTDAPTGATWRNYVSKYHRVVLRARWNYDDDTQDEYATLFDGAIYSPARSTAKLLQQDLSLTCRDRVMRCSKPWANIDAKYRAGAFLLMDKVEKASRAVSGGAFTFFGAELIHDILKVTFGDDVANSLNGGIDLDNPDPRQNGMLRYFPPLQPPLCESGYDVTGLVALQGQIDNQGKSIPQTGSGMMFPPPYRQNVIQWIQQIAALDNAVFYWGWPPGIEVEYPVPIIGRITTITRAARALGIYEIPDCDYGGSNDVNTAMMSVDSRLLVERDITRVITYAGQAPGEAQGVVPAQASGEARFAPGPDDDPDDGGERTLLQENDALLLVGMLAGGPANIDQFLEGISQLTLDQFAGINQEDISIAMRGDASLRWGREIRPQMNADGGETRGKAGDYSYDAMDLHDKPYHAQRIEHTLSFSPGGEGGGAAWDMTVAARPISTIGL